MRRPFRLRQLVEPAILVAAVVIFWWPYAAGRTLTTGGDMANLFFPVHTWVGQVVARDGVWPLWNPYCFLGHPLAAAAQSQVFYPPTRIVSRLLLDDPVRAMNTVLLLHWLWAGIGMWGFLRSRSGLGLRGWGPLGAGIGFACCGWWWGQIEHVAAVCATSWTPWLVWTGGMLVRNGRGARAIGGFGAALGMSLLAGHPQETFYALMLTAGWMIACLRRPAPRWRASWSGWSRRAGRGLGRLMLAGGLAGLLAAVLMLPTMELSRFSYRQFDDASYASSFSMPPALLLRMVIPNAFGSYASGYDFDVAHSEYGIFLGVPALVLAAVGFVLMARRRGARGINIAPGAWVFLAVCGIVLALGGNADPRRFFQWGTLDEFPPPGLSPLHLLTTLLPPTRHFRVPGRYLLLWSFAALTLAAVGIRCLETHSRRKFRLSRSVSPAWRYFPHVAGAASAALIFVSLYIPSRNDRLVFRGDYSQKLDWLRHGAGPYPKGPALDNRIFRLTISDPDLLMVDKQAPYTPEQPDWEERLFLRALRMFPNNNLPGEIALADGYEEGLLPIIPYKDFLFTFNRAFRRADPDARLLALGGIRWLWSDLPIESPEWSRVTPWPAAGALYLNRQWRGAAYYAGHFPEVDWEALEGTWLRTGIPTLGPGNVVLPYTLPGEAENSRESDIPLWTTSVETPNRLVCRREKEPTSPMHTQPPTLVLSQCTYPGWTARDAEGRPLPMQRRNAWNHHVELDKNQDFVRFSFEPWSFRLGAFFSALGMLGLGLCITFRRQLKKHAPYSS